jgi:hypothetical protein
LNNVESPRLTQMWAFYMRSQWRADQIRSMKTEFNAVECKPVSPSKICYDKNVKVLAKHSSRRYIFDPMKDHLYDHSSTNLPRKRVSLVRPKKYTTHDLRLLRAFGPLETASMESRRYE